MFHQVAFVSVLCLAASHHLGPDMLALDNPKVQSLVASTNEFSVTLYKQLAGSNTKNVIASPFSVSTAVGMLYAGSKGRTATEIEQALGFTQTGLSREDIHSAFHTLLTEQTSAHQGYDLTLANSIWITQTLPVLEQFKSTMKDIYFAEENQVEFGTQSATNLMNNWVNQKTKGKILKLFDKTLDETTAMVVINAIYFKGTWKTQFDKSKTVVEWFRNGDSDANTKRVPMMNVESKFGYGESRELGAQLLELPYKGEEVSMVVVLPRRGSTLADLHRKLTSRILRSAMDSIRSNQKVDVILPKFKTESSFSLKEALVSLGMESVFTRRANLTGISLLPLSVSAVLQKAVIEVNEEGSEAAAATGVQFISRSPSARDLNAFFYATHPFMYFIKHNPTKSVLFMGNINQL